jgi:hypothetical protein
MGSPFTRHLPTTLGTGSTRLDAFIHIANFFAIVSTSLADFRAHFAKTMLKVRVTELKIDGGLTDFGTIHHEAKMRCFNVFPTYFKAVIHSSLQANMMAMVTSFYTILHSVFSVIHRILLRKKQG